MSMEILKRAKAKFSNFFHDRSGASAIEFAMILPFAMFVYVGGAYTASTVTLNKKMQSASYAMINTVPYPRTFCSYQDFIEGMYESGFQTEAVKELLYPFAVDENSVKVVYTPTPPDADNKIQVNARIEYTPDTASLRVLGNLWSAFGGKPMGVEKTIWAESSRVTVTKDVPVCPGDVPLALNFDPDAATKYFEVMHGSLYNNKVSASGGVRYKYKYRSYTGTNLPGGLILEPDTGKFWGTVDVPCVSTNPQCVPTTLPDVEFGVLDYRDKVYGGAPDSASLRGSFVVWYQLNVTLANNFALVNQGQALTAAQQPGAAVTGGWPIASTAKGVTFTATGLPSGMSINAQTGDIAGSTLDWPRDYVVTITARDARENVSAPRTFTLRIQSNPLQLDPGPGKLFQYNTWDYQWFNVKGGAGLLTVSCTGLPAGLTCTSANAQANPTGWVGAGHVSGTPTQPGTYYVTITVSDQTGQVISSPPMYVVINVPPATFWFNHWNRYDGQVGTYYEGWFYTGGGSGNFGAYSCQGFPAGVGCYQSGRNFYIAGSPQQVGTFYPTIYIVDNVTGQTMSANVGLGVSPRPISVWYAYQGGTFQAYYDIRIAYGVSGGYGQLYYSCSGIPTGLSDIGYPNMSCLGNVGARYGDYSNCLTVWDSYGASAAACYNFNLAPRPITMSLTNFQGTYCNIGCIGYVNYSHGGGMGTRRFISYSASPRMDPQHWAWTSTTGQAYAGWGFCKATLTVKIGDDAGQQKAVGMYVDTKFC